MTTQSSQDLPEFQEPPVIEVVCGVLFKPVESLLAPHLGLLWEKFKPDYAECKEVPPLLPSIERFEGTLAPVPEIADIPPLPRVWFLHTTGNGIIQVQRDRFLHNWRRVRAEDEYPRYHRVIEMFRDRLSRIQAFLKEYDLGTIAPLQYEMTYINHIPQGSGWHSLHDIGKVFPDFAWRTNEGRFLPPSEDMNWRTTFLLPNRAGRLHATIRRAIRRSDQHAILYFDLTARGMSDDLSPEAMWGWFDMAHEWIVRGFADLTGSEVQDAVWRRTR